MPILEKTKKKYSSIQYLRGIAALLVVVLHTYAFESKAGVGASVLPAWSVFGSAGVDLFFVISGFVMVLTTDSTSRVSLFLYRRVSRIYPLYWVYSGILALGYLLLPTLVRREDAASVDYLSSFLLLPQEQLPLLVVGWTLIHEMYFYLVFAGLLLFPRKVLPKLLLVWLLTLLICEVFAAEEHVSPYYRLLSSPLTVEFILGCYIGHFRTSFKKVAGLKSLIIAVVFLLSSWIVQWSLYGEDPQGWLRVLSIGIPAAVLLFVCVRLEMVDSSAVRFKESRLHVFLERLGDASYSLYLSHFLVLSLLSRVFARCMGFLSPTALPGAMDNVVFVVFSLIVCVAFGFLSYRFIEQPLIRLFRRLV